MTQSIKAVQTQSVQLNFNPEFEEWDGVFLEDALGLSQETNNKITVSDIFSEVKTIYPSNAKGILIDDSAEFFDDLYSELAEELSADDKARVQKILTDAGFDSFGDMAKQLFGQDGIMDEEEFEKMLTLLENITGIDVTQSNNEEDTETEGKDKKGKKVISMTDGLDKDEDGKPATRTLVFDDGEQLTFTTDPNDSDTTPDFETLNQDTNTLDPDDESFT